LVCFYAANASALIWDGHSARGMGPVFFTRNPTCSAVNGGQSAMWSTNKALAILEIKKEIGLDEGIEYILEICKYLSANTIRNIKKLSVDSTFAVKCSLP
jgi:hypothetical protein